MSAWKTIVSFIRTLSRHLWQYTITPLASTSWFMFTEVIFQPILLGLALSLLFTHIQSIIGYNTAHAESHWWVTLEADMSAHYALYYAFFVILVIWSVLRVSRVMKERERDLNQRLINKYLLKAIADKLGVDSKILDLLYDERKNNKKSK